MRPYRLVVQQGPIMTDYPNDNKPTPLNLEAGPLSSEVAKPKAAGKADGSIPTF